MTTTLTPPGELLTEVDTLKLFQNRGLLRPDQLPRAKEKLRAYKDNQLANSEPLWPSIARAEAERQKETEARWLDGADTPGADDEEKALFREYDFISGITKQPGPVVAASPDRMRQIGRAHV